MRPRVLVQHPALRIAFFLFICVSLLWPNVPLLVSASAQAGNGNGKARPRPGKPEGTWPNLEDIHGESQLEREAPPPVPSTIRSQRNTGKPWDGRRVGDPFPHRALDEAKVVRVDRNSKSLRSHAVKRMTALPTIYEDQFIQNFFIMALARSATYEETLYWNYLFRAAYSETQLSLKFSAIEFGRTLFESAAYAARNRDPHWYVYDLYKTYLMREPDSIGWSNWEATVSTQGREYVRRGFEESTEFATLLGNVVPSGPSSANATSLISARMEPRNQPGNGMIARDAAWSVPLLSLPGRNGLDLGLTLSYSSMVWTRSGPYIYFDEDNGSPSPGFRLGFPTVQRMVFDAQTRRKSYLMITAAGNRVVLRQVGTSNIYEAADSSYLSLIDNGSLVIQSPDGTRLTFTYFNNEYRCSEVKDRNGNYITVNYNGLGQITNVIDTLSRVINFNYDGNANLISITQAWSGQPSHQWVSFGWGTRTMQSSFSGAAVVGPANGALLPVITQVAVNDTSYFTFDYTNSLQVSVIRKYFGATERNATSFTYETPGSDVPRLISSSVSAQNWTGVNGVSSQVTTQYSVAADGACVLTAPDGTVYKEYYGTGWQRGLTTRSEVWSGGNLQKWITTAWTQDNTSVEYEVNPRVTETNIYDSSNNRRRTTIDYGPYAQYGLPYIVREYGADGGIELRQTVIDYNLSPAYLNQRVIGLVSEVQLKNGAGQAFNKTTYSYDDPARLHGVPAAATQHDVNYNLSFTARGNVTAVSRWDVNDINTAAKKLTTYTDYYNTGTPMLMTDPAGHPSSISYTDSFSDSVNRNTFAYPTTVTDADGFSSYVQYNYEFGATTRTQSPAPAGQSQGAIQTMNYNSLGQLERITTTNNGAYKRFWYGADYTASFATVNNVADEAYSILVMDGLGRVTGVIKNHPGSTGGYSLVNTIYDQMGHAWKISNPTEVNSSWVPSGDDAAGMYYTTQTYDWKGRPLVTTNQDGTTRQASYAGCACAGGEVVTLVDEGTIDAGVAKHRQEKIYTDVFGRPVKTEILNWQGGTPYSTTVNAYNARDQITQILQYAGAEAAGPPQQTTITYDGYGRQATRHTPEQDPGTATVYTYNTDDTIRSVTDARGATATHSYNNRHLLTAIMYSAPAGITPTSPATFSYDAAGNRTSMMDGLGSKTYNYDQLSRLSSETRTFTGVGIFTFTYQYNLNDRLKKFTDASNSTINYGYDVAGQLTGVTGSDTLVAGVSTYASGFRYRAWRGLKQVSVGPLNSSFNYDSRMQTTNFNISGVVHENYEYYSDGRLKFVDNVTDGNFDRALAYDHVGRLTFAAAGGGARQDAGPMPFLETFGYNAFDDLTQRETESWQDSHYYDAGSFTNHRRAFWGYDASGRITTIDTRTYTYDAAGRNITLTGQQWTSSGYIPTFIQSGFDGDGNRVRENSGSSGFKYYLQSSVLGGAVIEELNSTGQKQTGYVYASSGTPLATQTIGQSFVKFKQASPLQTTERGAFTTGSASRVEFDPVGAKIRNFPITPPDRGDGPGDMPTGGSGSLDSRYSALGNPGAGCTLDGVYMPCYMAMRGVGTASDVVAVNQFYAVAARTSRNPVWVEEDTSTAVRTADNELTIYAGLGGHYEWVDDPDDVLAVFSQSARMTHNALPLPSDLKSKVEQIVNNPKTGCARYIKELIGLATAAGRAYSDDAMTLYQRVADQAGFKLKKTPYGGESNNEGSKRVVYVNPVPMPGTAREREHAEYKYAIVVLNELMHHARKSGLYNDRALATAAFNLLKPDDQAKHPLPKSSSALVNSRYFHPLFNLHCRSVTGE